MIISRTPYRVSLLGGGTDYPEWYNTHEGAVLGMAINKYCYITLRDLPPYFGYHTKVVYSTLETVSDNSEISHPAVRACLEYFGIEDGLEIHYQSDLPARKGMGTSSSFVVGLLKALNFKYDFGLSASNIVDIAMIIQRDKLNETVGIQDTLWAAYGGCRYYQLHNNDYTQISVNLNDVVKNLMLFDTGNPRIASEVARKQVADFVNKKGVLSGLTNLATFGLNEPERIGEFIDLDWDLKKRLHPDVTSTEIDDIHIRGLKAGAISGKLLGAGAGGFMLFYVEPEYQEEVKNAVNLRYIPFSWEPTGSRILRAERSRSN